MLAMIWRPVEGPSNIRNIPCLRPAAAPPCHGWLTCTRPVHMLCACNLCTASISYMMCMSKCTIAHVNMCKRIFCTKCTKDAGSTKLHALLTECAGIARVRGHRAVAPTHQLKAQTLVCARLFCRANWRQRDPACGGPLVFIQRLNFDPSYTSWMFACFAKFVFNTQDHLW